MNALSNTEEMYILFGGRSNNETSNNNLASPHEEDTDAYFLDPFVASGEAHLPDDIIELLSSDEEEDSKVQEKESSTAKEEKVYHHMDMLLKIDAKDYADDYERLLKLMSLAIQNGAPSNLVTLYLNGHLQKSHILNYIKTSVKSRKPITIDMSNVDFSNGYTPSNPIDLLSPMSIDSKPSNKEDQLSPEITSTTMVSKALKGEPSANLKHTNQDSKRDMSKGDDYEFAPPNKNKGKLDLKTFKEYSE